MRSTIPAGRSRGWTLTKASCRESATENEYERAERPARLASGEEIAAWVYLYRGDVAGLSAVPGGRWVAGQP